MSTKKKNKREEFIMLGAALVAPSGHLAGAGVPRIDARSAITSPCADAGDVRKSTAPKAEERLTLCGTAIAVVLTTEERNCRGCP